MFGLKRLCFFDRLNLSSCLGIASTQLLLGVFYHPGRARPVNRVACMPRRDVLVVAGSPEYPGIRLGDCVSSLVCQPTLLGLVPPTAAPVARHEAEAGVFLLDAEGLIEDVIEIEANEGICHTRDDEQHDGALEV